MTVRTEQTPVGGTVTIPAGGTKQYEYESPVNGQTEFISLVEALADKAGVVNMDVEIISYRGSDPEVVPEPMNDGPDKVSDDLLTGDKQHPVPVSDFVGNTRFLTSVQLEDKDRIVFSFDNTDGANPHDVTFRASSATTSRAAFGTGGTR